MKSDKLFNATNSLIIGTSLFMIGILLIVGREWLYINVVNIFLIAILFLSLKKFFNYFIGKKKDKQINLTTSVLNLLFCFICSLFRNIPISILPIIFGIYLLINAIIKLINASILWKNKANGRLVETITFLIYFTVSISIIFAPIKNLSIVLLIIGIYILLFRVL